MIPPLAVNKDQIDDGLAILDAALTEYEEELEVLVKN